MYFTNERFAKNIKALGRHGFFPSVIRPSQNPLIISELSQIIGIPLVCAHQVHSNKVVVVSEPWTTDKAPDADAMITKLENVALGVWTADCIPLLMIDSIAGIVAVVHCGWRGAVNGIISNCLIEMQKLGSNPSEIQCLIGPCIRQDSYEVGADVYAAVTECSSEQQKRIILKALGNDKFLFDIPAYVKHQLNLGGINLIYDCEIDTYKNEQFASFRRSIAQKKQYNANILSFIAMPRLEDWINSTKGAITNKPKARASSASLKEPRIEQKQMASIVHFTGLRAEKTLDLHGTAIDEAFNSMETFLEENFALGNKFVLVITGKGSARKKDDSKTLNTEVPRWLEDTHLKKYVSHFTSANNKDGGKGALYVFLKKNRLAEHT